MELQTERLLLRELVGTDFDAVHAYAVDPEVVRFMPWGPNSEAETLEFLGRAREGASADPRLGYELAVVRQEDSRLIGAIGLHRRAADAPIAMLGYCFSREAWGEGYATEAGIAVLDFGFEALGLHRIWAGCDPDNQASARVLEKLGMAREGHHRQDTLIKGEWRDSLMFAALAEEWAVDHGRGI